MPYEQNGYGSYQPPETFGGSAEGGGEYEFFGDQGGGPGGPSIKPGVPQKRKGMMAHQKRSKFWDQFKMSWDDQLAKRQEAIRSQYEQAIAGASGTEGGQARRDARRWRRSSLRNLKRQWKRRRNMEMRRLKKLRMMQQKWKKWGG
jgi:hypothetical protein